MKEQNTKPSSEQIRYRIFASYGSLSPTLEGDVVYCSTWTGDLNKLVAQISREEPGYLSSTRPKYGVVGTPPSESLKMARNLDKPLLILRGYSGTNLQSLKRYEVGKLEDAVIKLLEGGCPEDKIVVGVDINIEPIFREMIIKKAADIVYGGGRKDE